MSNPAETRRLRPEEAAHGNDDLLEHMGVSASFMPYVMGTLIV